jgi:HNH endonuclease
VRASTRSHEQKIEQLHAEARAALCDTHHDDSPAALGSSETPVGSPAVSSSSRPRGTPQEHPTGTARLGIERCRDIGMHKLSSPCELWDRKINGNGYGEVSINGAMRMAHRVAYELLRGPIPEGWQLHHLCENRACVNVDHLVAVTRKLHEWITWALYYCKVSPAPETRCCPRGHTLSDSNVYVLGRRGIECRTCNLQSKARQRSARRLAA